ncbi:VOC family protein [Luethyella okanaganae]|uniref:VOC family protein n=1 Tax=Luethyella okanaganae TaxID=69372 RepID=A0ABW1VC96_9MICO
MMNATRMFAVLPAQDITRARTFYSEKFGIEPDESSVEGDFYRLTDGFTFLLYETPYAGTAQNTAMGWETEDLDTEVARLRSLGVEFQDYDIPGLKTENGIATTGSEKAAWFTDSEGNILAVSQRL